MSTGMGPGHRAGQKGETLKELKALRGRAEAMEREKGTHLYNARSEFRAEFSTLEEVDTKASQDRRTEGVKLRQQLNKIQNMVKKFARELKDIKPSPEFVERLKVIMEDIESTINQFKEQQRHQYEALMLEERTASLEIQALEKRFESWHQSPDPGDGVKSKNPQQPPTSSRDVLQDLPAQVGTFERFVQQSGGVRGGWDEYDHQTFLKYRVKHKGKITFLEALVPVLPTRSETEIREHETWFQQYTYLNDRKKDAIQAWRRERQDQREELLVNAAASSSEDEEGAAAHAQQQQDECIHRKMEINAWKLEKEIKRAEAEERKLRGDLMRAEKEETEKRRKLVKKQQVDGYRRQREERRQASELRADIEVEEAAQLSRQRLAQDAIRFKDRDDQKLQAKLAKARAQQEAEKEREQRLEEMKGEVVVTARRDPNRLYQLTEGWKERQKEAKDQSSQGQVYQMPHRAVPSWRQGLS